MAGTNIVVVDRGDDTTCSINLLGATVVSWRIKNVEQLFVSEKTRFDQQTAVSGGVQIIFPHYGYWKFGPEHGFARLVRWNLEKAPHKIASGDIEVVFSLTDTEYTKSIWNYQFRIVYRLILREKELRFYVAIQNLSDKVRLKFDFFINTYVRVSDIRDNQIVGLYRAYFFDKHLSVEDTFVENKKYLNIENRIELIYTTKTSEIIIINCSGDRLLEMQKENFPNILVWNPWKEGMGQMTYFDQDDYLKMICIGFGYIDNQNYQTLQPGGTINAMKVLKFDM